MKSRIRSPLPSSRVKLKDTVQKLRAAATVDVLDPDLKKAMDEDAKAAAIEPQTQQK